MSKSANGRSEFDAVADEICRALEWIRNRHGLNHPQLFLIAKHVLEADITAKVKTDLEAMKRAGEAANEVPNESRD